MNRFGISLFALFVLFACCFPLNAQVHVEDEPFDVEEVEVEVSDPQFAPGKQPFPSLSTMMRLTQLTLEMEQQGKTLHLRREMEGIGYEKLIGLSEAQSAHLDSQQSMIFQENYGKTFMDRQERLLHWTELSADEFNQLENEYIASHRKARNDAEAIYREALTPIQFQNVMEYELAVPPCFSYFFGDADDDVVLLNLSAYEALDLSEEQKKMMQEFQKALDAQWKDFFEEYMEFASESFALMQSSTQEGLSEENKQNLVKKLEKLTERKKSISQKNRKTINEILTQEQKDRLAALREEMPKKLAAIREELAKQVAESSDDSWKDSWKPGDPLPEEAVPSQREPRFPFKF